MEKGYFNGEFVPVDQIGWPLDDWGPTLGAIAVERFRSFGGHFVALERHFERLEATCRGLGIDFPLVGTEFAAIVSRLAESWAGEDRSIVALASPGRRQGATEPTVIIYAESIPWRRLAAAYSGGVSLVLSDHRAVPSACWPQQWKTRSRLVYLLADRQAADRSGDLFASGLLRGEGDEIADTSIASVVLCRGGEACTPDDVLGSVTLSRYRPWLEEHYRLRQRPVNASELEECDEILLLGSTAQVLAVRRLWLGETTRELPGVEGPSYRQLRQEATRELRCNFVEQAIDNAE